MDAHRLLLMAATMDKQAKLLEAMFHGYFEQSRPLFLPEDLLAITDEVGINHGVAREVLASDEYRDDVEEDVKMAQSLITSCR